MLTMSADELVKRAGSISRKLRKTLPTSVTLVTHPGESSAGGGSFPLLQLPTTLIEVRIAGLAPQQIEEALRLAAVPVIGRIHRARFLLDVRTILDRDIPVLSAMLALVAAAPREVTQ
jgi:L-seryl-tRNA(Ser) seleniumtransferase